MPTPPPLSAVSLFPLKERGVCVYSNSTVFKIVCHWGEGLLPKINRETKHIQNVSIVFNTANDYTQVYPQLGQQILEL